MDTTSVIPAKAGIQVANMTFYDFIDVEFKESKWYPNEPPRGKPRGISKLLLSILSQQAAGN
jgi:hypothetical protein